MSKASDICFREVVPFCEKRLARSFCQRISETVSEIEAGWMPALAVSAPSSASHFDLGGVDGNEFYAEPMNKEIQLTARHFAVTRFQHNSGFQCIWCGEEAGSVIANTFEETLPFRLCQKDGEQGGSIDDHQCGIPWES